MKLMYDRWKLLAFSNGVKLFLACVIVFGISYFYLSYYRNAFYYLTADEGYIYFEKKPFCFMAQEKIKKKESCLWLLSEV